MKIKLIIIITIIIIAYFIYKIIKHVTSVGNSAQKELIIPASTFLKPGGTTNECSYSIWFIIDNWTNGEKILFQKQTLVDTPVNTNVVVYYEIIVNYDTGETGTNNPVGNTGTTGITGTTGTTGYTYMEPTVTYEFKVSFDNYVNNLNIFLPELNSHYKKSSDCKITKELLDETGANNLSIDDCKKKCSEYSSFDSCNSFSYESLPEQPIKDVSFKFDTDGNFEGNDGYGILMDNQETFGKCYLYASSPSMPNHCFPGMTGTDVPYSVYDWDDFIYSNNIVSYVKENCSVTIPIQKWTSLIIIIKNKTMEIYLNGMLVKQCSLMKEISLNDNLANFIITPNRHGFNGSTMKFEYWNKCLTTSEITKLSKKLS